MSTKTLLREYGFLKSFVKLGVMVVIPFLTYLRDETAQRFRTYSKHCIIFGRESELSTRSVWQDVKFDAWCALSATNIFELTFFSYVNSGRKSTLYVRIVGGIQ